MRLLITTQAVDLNDPVLGFFHRWIEEFAKHCESVSVICLKEGRHDLPANVSVYSLGKENGASRVKYILRFYTYLWRLRHGYDAVFVHMNPEYVILAGWWWRFQKKRIVMWYVHRQLSLVLRVAVALVDKVCTTAKESISVSNTKIAIMGHGIDVTRYAAYAQKSVDTHTPRIVSVGRITPIKHLEIIVDALAKMRARGVRATLDLVGMPVVASDMAYQDEIVAQFKRLHLEDAVSFVGAIKNDEMPALYPRYDFSVNACPTGGIDKAVLESMAAGTIPIVSNVAFRDYFGSLADDLIFADCDTDDLAEKIVALLARDDLADMQIQLRTSAKEKADVTTLISTILTYLA